MIRPGARELLKNMSTHYEIVIFSSKSGFYVNPIINKLDTGNHVTHRLFRRDCVVHKSTYLKDITHIGRDLSQVIMLENNPTAYYF